MFSDIPRVFTPKPNSEYGIMTAMEYHTSVITIGFGILARIELLSTENE